MSTPVKTILITGANKGIGLETGRQLARLGHRVILSARSAERGERAVKDLAAEGLKTEFLLLDTADEQSIHRAARELKERITALHVLINNAAILNVWQGSIIDTKADDLRDTFATNVTGPILLTQALVPLLEAGRPARVINISSRLGSMHDMGDGWASYGISKAALNAATRKMASALQSRGISVIAASPGWVKTDMGGAGATLSLEQGGKNIVQVVTEIPPTVTDEFLQGTEEIAW
jgi:NAD(P)-dependent dehydrogenase (short-subunit alcohol dehydrogenase family)